MSSPSACISVGGVKVSSQAPKPVVAVPLAVPQCTSCDGKLCWSNVPRTDPCKEQERLQKQLLSSAKEGNVLSVESLIDRGVTNFGWAFIGAVENGQLAVVKVLIDRWPDRLNSDIMDHLNDALIPAAENGHLHIVEHLLYCGAWNRDALMCAAADGHLAIVQCLLNEGMSSQESLDEAHRMALDYKHDDIAKLLVESGAWVEKEYIETDTEDDAE